MDDRPSGPAGIEAGTKKAGIGHNQPTEVVWERWQRKRTFVRALEGTYGELQAELYDQPRVYGALDQEWRGGS